jgi:hypothetical protein
MALCELETPPRDIDRNITGADAVAVYESDLDHPELVASLRAHRFQEWRTFRDGPARAVVVFRRGSRAPSAAREFKEKR